MQDWYGIIAICFIGIVGISAMILIQSTKERQLIRSGKLPAPGDTSDADILRLAQSGHRIWAIKRYRQLHGCSLKDAKAKIEAIAGKSYPPG